MRPSVVHIACKFFVLREEARIGIATTDHHAHTFSWGRLIDPAEQCGDGSRSPWLRDDPQVMPERALSKLDALIADQSHVLHVLLG